MYYRLNQKVIYGKLPVVRKREVDAVIKKI